ncbi:hypothetical protein PSAN_46100 [Pseudomonas antarctica]|uniref:Uncharacterized protein n=1 Tax=Pseudomonas antarctica TaxID=219572 RepID=A0ABQ6ZPW8_9PSED|nr:hypothetical protein PSAN_46100 [Pseudomonas antarctica]
MTIYGDGSPARPLMSVKPQLRRLEPPSGIFGNWRAGTGKLQLILLSAFRTPQREK